MAFPSIKKPVSPKALVDAGEHPAVIRSIAYAGIQAIGPSAPSETVVVEFVIPEEFGPVSLHRRYRYSIGTFTDRETGEQRPSALRELLGAVIPDELKAFDDSPEFEAELPLEKLLGQPVRIAVGVNTSDSGATFSNITKVMADPDAKPGSPIESVMFDGQDRVSFRMLPPEIQAICRRGGISL